MLYVKFPSLLLFDFSILLAEEFISHCSVLFAVCIPQEGLKVADHTQVECSDGRMWLMTQLWELPDIILSCYL